MVRKPITRESLSPSYDEIINELLNSTSKLIIENIMMKLKIQKLESLLEEIVQEPNEEPHYDKKEF